MIGGFRSNLSIIRKTEEILETLPRVFSILHYALGYTPREVCAKPQMSYILTHVRATSDVQSILELAVLTEKGVLRLKVFLNTHTTMRNSTKI